MTFWQTVLAIVVATGIVVVAAAIGTTTALVIIDWIGLPGSRTEQRKRR